MCTWIWHDLARLNEQNERGHAALEGNRICTTFSLSKFWKKCPWSYAEPIKSNDAVGLLRKGSMTVAGPDKKYREGRVQTFQPWG